jgi:CHAT domain-containing protein
MLAAHSITYVPTARMARLLAGSVDLSAGSLVVVHSRCSDSVLLRESFEREAECVARVTGGSLLAGEEASPKALTEMLGGRRLVHFTCHGMFDGDDVRHSGLLLAGDHGSDALCDVEALSRMRLDVDLVVLAGCETGLSDRHPGDELVGLVRAFTLAGAGSVLASLWPVHTLSTEILMRRFYSELVSGIRQSDALRAAQMHVRSCTRSEVVAELRRELESRGEGACGAGRDLLTQRIRLLEAGEDDGGAVGTCPAARPPRGGPAEHEALPYAHPYFWAPFVLVGGMR